MLKIRLQMTGRRNDRHFRIIVTEHTAGPKSGKYVEKLGFIDNNTKERKINAERVKYWLSVGAQPSDRVYNILVDEKILEGPKKNVLPKKTPIVSEEVQKEAAVEQTTESAGESDDAATDSGQENGGENGENATEDEVEEKSE